jgi:hypothetical protein
MELFRFPFHFRNGTIAKLDSDTDEYAAQCVLAAVSTGRGELAISPQFGTDSPEFVGFDTPGLYSTMGTYYPQIRIVDVTEEIASDGRERVAVEFERNGDAVT